MGKNNEALNLVQKYYIEHSKNPDQYFTLNSLEDLLN